MGSLVSSDPTTAPDAQLQDNATNYNYDIPYGDTQVAQVSQAVPNVAQAKGGLSVIHNKDDNPEDPVCAVIVTIRSGSSYDDLFNMVPQKSSEGRIVVYSAVASVLDFILQKFNGQDVPDFPLLKSLFHDISQVDPPSVLFNWECCSDWSGSTFNHYKDITFKLMAKILQNKHMIMYSDFALKALIGDWQEEHLGPNPFINIGSFSDSFDLAFDPSHLTECPSTQLQNVGELCAKGTACVHALGGTIAFTVDKNKADTSKYKLQILTVATRLGSFAIPANRKVSVAGHQGAAGHVLLTYPSGGTLLVSCGHWIELSKLDVSVDSLVKMAQKEMGESYTSQMMADLSLGDEVERSSKMQSYAKQFVQQSAPCNVSKKKSMW
eukprot:TRINITY_DN324_c0_g2_i1.p1 TRINITY_DN324_c0_g2~~TRINITY_DN324_c0_g2_i1.p1  ORF type:complete len:380 (-),score=26.22 TRINITY_DN324_c0_g2_i1:48-1187(-)